MRVCFFCNNTVILNKRKTYANFPVVNYILCTARKETNSDSVHGNLTSIHSKLYKFRTDVRKVVLKKNLLNARQNRTKAGF